jgi:mannose-1-phosphate guanylyltransferase
MKAMLLAAGKGTRVRPLTDTVPKPMIPIINKPVMEFLIDGLRQHGFDQIIVSTSYLAHEIENYFRDGSRFGVQIAYSFEGYHADGQVIPGGRGSAGGLKKIQDFSGFFDDTFAVLCGDALLDLDLTSALAFHRDRKAIATIVLKDVPRAEVWKYGVVKTEADGRIVQFQEKPAPADAVSTTINTGIYFFDPAVFDHIPADTAFDIGGQLLPLLADKGLPFYGVALPFSWLDIGSTPDYWQATQMILRGDFKVEMPGRELAPGVWGGINLVVDLTKTDIRPPVYLGSSTTIEPGATVIGPTVIGHDCLIQTGARLDACVVGDYTRVSGFADLHEKIVSGRFCVDRHGHNVELAKTGYAFVVDDARERRRRVVYDANHRRRSTDTDEDRILMEFLASQDTRNV